MCMHSKYFTTSLVSTNCINYFYMCGCKCASVYCLHAVLRRPEEGVRFPGISVCLCTLRIRPGSLEGQPMLKTAKPSLQPLPDCFISTTDQSNDSTKLQIGELMRFYRNYLQEYRGKVMYKNRGYSSAAPL
jgi:hypothetical protein